jgi:hypothetical protein
MDMRVDGGGQSLLQPECEVAAMRATTHVWILLILRAAGVQVRLDCCRGKISCVQQVRSVLSSCGSMCSIWFANAVLMVRGNSHSAPAPAASVHAGDADFRSLFSGLRFECAHSDPCEPVTLNALLEQS